MAAVSSSLAELMDFFSGRGGEDKSQVRGKIYGPPSLFPIPSTNQLDDAIRQCLNISTGSNIEIDAQTLICGSTEYSKKVLQMCSLIGILLDPPKWTVRYSVDDENAKPYASIYIGRAEMFHAISELTEGMPPQTKHLTEGFLVRPGKMKIPAIRFGSTLDFALKVFGTHLEMIEHAKRKEFPKIQNWYILPTLQFFLPQFPKDTTIPTIACTKFFSSMPRPKRQVHDSDVKALIEILSCPPMHFFCRKDDPESLQKGLRGNLCLSKHILHKEHPTCFVYKGKNRHVLKQDIRDLLIRDNMYFPQSQDAFASERGPQFAEYRQSHCWDYFDWLSAGVALTSNGDPMELAGPDQLVEARLGPELGWFLDFGFLTVNQICDEGLQGLYERKGMNDSQRKVFAESLREQLRKEMNEVAKAIAREPREDPENNQRSSIARITKEARVDSGIA